MKDEQREALLKEYGEVRSDFRLLTDIRFKLLAFLPIAAAATAGIKDWKGLGVGVEGLWISLFGLVATLGLVTYNARNDQLYNELVERAAFIERKLGLRDGAFANRPRAWLTIALPGLRWKVEHSTGIGIIYAATIALWLFGILLPTVTFLRRGYTAAGFTGFPSLSPETQTKLLALTIAVIVTWLGVAWLRSQSRRRREELRLFANLAVTRAEEIDLKRAATDASLITLCAKLSDQNEGAIMARAQYFSSADLELVRFYLPVSSRRQAAIQFVANLTDLPPGWLSDCVTNRRGNVPIDAPSETNGSRKEF